MNFTSDLVLDIYSIILLIFIFIHALKVTEKNLLQQKLYMLLLKVTVLMLIVDIFSRFDGNQGTIYSSINHIANFLIFLLSPVAPSLWLLYAHFQVYHEEKKLRGWLYPLLAIHAANAAMLVLSQYFGWYYYIDSDNIYHRGPLYWFPVFITVALVLLAALIIIRNYKSIEKKYFSSLVFFAVPPLICIILQIIFYGTSLILHGITLSLLMVFINIQNQNMNTDYLTGAYNRKSLETFMREKISASTENKTFSAILIDLDDFKFINDTLGHDMGDYVLATSVKLIKSCFRSIDFIARFGGDEFYIILDVSNRDDLEAAVCRIKNCIKKHNEHGNNRYRLSLSMGYAVYDYQSHMTVEEFQKQIDELMYENKRANKMKNKA